MADLAARLAALSPERRRILHLLAERGGTREQDPPSAPDAAGLDDAKRACAHEYDALNRSLDASEFGAYSYFLNYGYVPEAGPHYAAVALPEYCLNKNSIRLVLETIGDRDVDGKHVLDIGCGRGGTVTVLMQFFKPAAVSAVDLSPAAINFCRRTHRYANVRFEVGDAERLCFPDASVDIVTNIESSSCYPDLAAFYRDVWRVLRPGGWFLYADCLLRERMESCRAELRELGFTIVQDRDVTRNVLRSCDEIAQARVSAYGSSPRAEALESFLGVPGSAIYESMRNGQRTYFILAARKPAAPEAS